jgi:hypothetical protein
MSVPISETGRGRNVGTGSELGDAFREDDVTTGDTLREDGDDIDEMLAEMVAMSSGVNPRRRNSASFIPAKSNDSAMAERTLLPTGLRAPDASKAEITPSLAALEAGDDEKEPDMRQT